MTFSYNKKNDFTFNHIPPHTNPKIRPQNKTFEKDCLLDQTKYKDDTIGVISTTIETQNTIIELI